MMFLKNIIALFLLIIPFRLEQTTFKVEPKPSKCQSYQKNEGKLFECKYPEFSIAIFNVPTMANEAFVDQTYDWFKRNVIYGNEIWTFNGILFDGRSQEGNEFGSYSYPEKQIFLFPNNQNLLYNNPISLSIAKKFNKDFIDPKKDLDYWKYTIAHEYAHHQTIIYGSNGFTSEKKFNGKKISDFTLNDEGKEYIKWMGLDKKKQYHDKGKIKALAPYYISPGIIWPEVFISETMMNYLWTNAEILARNFILYTYTVPKELQNENSVNAFGGTVYDYWWMHHLGANLYEKHRDKNRQPIQEPVDNKLAEWKSFIDDEWLNDDELAGKIMASKNGSLLFTSTSRNASFSLESISKKDLFYNSFPIEKRANFKFNKRPFDFRKSLAIEIDSYPFMIKEPIVEGKYKIKFNDKTITKGFNLQLNEKLLIKTTIGVYIIKNTKEGMILESTTQENIKDKEKINTIKN